MAERKASMTDRERVEALLRHEKPDRVPIWPFAPAGFCCVYTGTSIADAYNKPDVSLAAQRKTAQDFGWVFAPILGYAAMGPWEFGGDIKWPSGDFAQAPTVARVPVETEEDVWNLKVPDVKNSGIVPLQMEFYKLSTQESLDNEPFNVFSYISGPFTFSGLIAGVEKFSKWTLTKPKVAHHLLQLTCDYTIQLAQYYKDTFGIEGVLFMGGDPTASNQIISPKQFEEFVMPYQKENNEKILAMGYKHFYMHICGEQNLNLPYWSQVSLGDPGIVSFGHEIELETMASYFPNDIILGNLEPAIIQVRTPDEVYEAAKKNILDDMEKCPAGYIFSPGCELPPMTPVENVKAMGRAINDVGWYD